MSNDSLAKTPQKSSTASPLIDSEKISEESENQQSPSFASAKSMSPEIVVAEPVEPSKQVTEEAAKISGNHPKDKMPVDTPKSVANKQKLEEPKVLEEKAKENIRPSEKSTAVSESGEKPKISEAKVEGICEAPSKPSFQTAQQPEVQEPVTNTTPLAPTPELKPQVPELDKTSAGCKCTIM